MAIYKCKMCGGDLEVAEGLTVVECEYCGTKQTVPTSNDEEIRNLFNRANLLRRKCEFDKAEEIYEKILEKDEKQPEAYWCVLLCRYGIEYVEDPKTYKRTPTCHRTSFEAITSDEYYKLALKYADPVQKKIYEEEAKYIDGVQKDILAISQKEEPYDVFICYKETDENGKRTEDSAIANDIYYQLTQEGYKVFYAAITLEDKLGSAYEPIIFAALHSAKVMLAIGTKPEYFNAVWVKNEWSRYLKLMKSDKTKQLIPCFRGMDAYELPEEFAHLQAQDMGKIGFINDLVRGIKKVIVKEKPQEERIKNNVGASVGVSSLLQRMDLFLEDREWDRAKEYAEKVLDIDPENAEAYIGELLAELKITKFVNLYKHTEPIASLPLFKKAFRFADKELKSKLDQAASENENFLENKRLDGIYTDATTKERIGTSESDFLSAAKLFESILSYKDSVERAKQCREKAERAREEAKRMAEEAELQRKMSIYQDGCAKLQSGDIETVFRAKELFRSTSGFKDAAEKIIECDREIERLRLARRESIYVAACNALQNGKTESDVSKARKDFELLGDYKDSKEKVAACDEWIAKLKERVAEKERQNAIAAAKRKKKKIAICVVSGILVALIIIAIIVAGAVTNHKEKVASAGLAYTLSADGSYYIVSDVADNTLDEYIIPEIYHGLPVKEIGENAFFLSDMTSVVISDSVTTIGECAFRNCNNLTSVTLGSGVAKIEEKAFSDCENLTKIHITDLAAWCNIDFSFSDGAGWKAYHLFLNGTEVKDLVIPQGVTEIKPFAFYSCEGLQRVTIPNGVISIGQFAFGSCNNLASISIPNSITKINDGVFSDSGLTSITIPDSITSIGAYAFSNCDGLTEITIPKNVATIYDGAFSWCDNIQTVHWNAKNCAIEGDIGIRGSIFSDSSALTNVIIGEEVKQLPDYFLDKCHKVTSIVIPDNVTSIGKRAFRSCNGLINVTIGKGVTKIGEEAFELCSKLANAYFKDPIGWRVGNHVFTSEELSNPATAAKYLLSYNYDDWSKS